MTLLEIISKETGLSETDILDDHCVLEHFPEDEFRQTFCQEDGGRCEECWRQDRL
ncbi:hypothetical protein LPY66_18415 [Dehalobacter sp. DCM]|uniref:hypothetical protein n=1 Tax=Dehalobacter sp. DCM TaxID=2907827 RepID=UPI0030812B1E|nr:hypothetical protein LPY66_18415 [Dehalobacter sp. DCM]